MEENIFSLFLLLLFLVVLSVCEEEGEGGQKSSPNKRTIFTCNNNHCSRTRKEIKEPLLSFFFLSITALCVVLLTQSIPIHRPSFLPSRSFLSLSTSPEE